MNLFNKQALLKMQYASCQFAQKSRFQQTSFFNRAISSRSYLIKTRVGSDANYFVVLDDQ